MDGKLKDDPQFWQDINTPRDPAYTEPDPEDLVQLKDAVYEAVGDLATRISVREQAYRAAGHEAPDGVVLSGDYQLTLLYVLHHVTGLVEQMAADAAKIAGHQDVSYTKLGAAWGGITRQSARTKWPDAVPARGRQQQDPVPFEYAGGQATVYHDAEAGAWWYIAAGADGKHEESGSDFDTHTAATAAATAFLIQHAKETAR
ncbi:hypothetical protein ACIHFC_28645 [Streptomyces sp. NPDC052013]|uniref:hypothetical protein n=1 Tax=Streptomyces sp. NPDC052013 TaxID=3365679 RepID=UPI0037D90BA6